MMIRNSDRTDTVEEKLRLLQSAYGSGRHDLAMSLAESIKDTLSFIRQTESGARKQQLEAGKHAAVETLPEPWARWADGWKYYKYAALFEEVGIARSREPLELTVSFPASQTTDLQREVRVARVDDEEKSLREVVSQIQGERRNGDERVCRIVVPAEVAPHGSALYLIFYGNPFAELPDYATDLRVSGEEYRLDISNVHYIARLSRQMGQLERLTYRRQHGLELYAGGKGHGEPPTIDWAHDYVDEGGFQKLRVKNWSRCPNHEVVRGPLCVTVRRWGFPHSPVHPIFTPSRMHVDVTYTFYAGVPYFFKESRMEAIKDLSIEAMRDDEWVFSGYSFTDRVWIDSRGKLHEGAVPPEHAEDLWGVGFFHRESRDAFLALWLEHRAENFPGIQHGGAPTLHYDGHGQLWSRYPANKTRLKAGAAFLQKNAYLVSPYPRQGAAAQVETLRHRLLHPPEVSTDPLPRVTGARSAGSLGRPGETALTAPLKPAIWDALRQVRDEQLYKVDANIVDLGLVHDVRVRGGTVHVIITTPHTGRPVYEFYVSQGGGRVEEGIRERVRRLEGVRDVVVSHSTNPPWTVARLTDDGRKALGL